MSALSETEKLSDLYYRFLEQTLLQENSTLIYPSFKGLTNAKKETVIFKNWREKMLEVSNNLKIQIDDYLLEILIMLNLTIILT